VTRLRLLSAVLCALLVLGSTIPVSGALAASAPPERSTDLTDSPWDHNSIRQIAAQNETENQNETTQQKDPDDVGEDGNQEAIADWLSGSMADRLGGGAVEISQGDYQTARSLLGDDFESDLSRYIDVQGETSANSETANTYEQTRQAQQNYSEKSQTYQETYDQYQQAIENGDLERARELARKIARLESTLNETSAELQDNYAQLENQTGESFDPATQAIDDATRNVTETTDEVLNQTLVETSIEIERVSERASFEDPLVVEGRAVTANGSAVADAMIVVSVPGDDIRVRTDENGTFTIEHRPVALETGPQNLTVALRPSSTSIYQTSSATVTTVIDPVEATLSVTGAPASVGFSEPLAVEAQLTVDGRPVPDSRVNLTLASSLSDSAWTNSNGTATFGPSLPAAIDAGTHPVTVRLPWEGRAVQADPVTRTVTVESTDTTLSLHVENGETITVNGTLESIDGIGVGGQQIVLAVDGTTIETLQTNQTGMFVTTLGSADVPVNESVSLSVRYDGSGSNLESAQANTTAMLSQAGAGPEGSQSPFGLSIVTLAGGIGILLALAVLVGWYRRRPTTEADETAADAVVEAPQETPEPDLTDTLSSVEQQLDAGESDDAAITLYETVLQSLSIHAGPEQTHWERYHDVVDSLPSDQAELLEEATTLYERAQFAPTMVATESVSNLAQTVGQFVRSDEQTVPADD